MKKTVFIVITRGFIVRNILRSGVLELLKKSGAKVIIFFPSYGRNIPESLRKEFEDSKVSLIAVSEPKRKGLYQKGYKLFSRLTSELVFTLTTWKYNQIGKRSKLERDKIWSYLELYIYTILSKIHFLKIVVRWIEQYIFRESYYSEYFKTYKPDVVFSTSIMSKLDIQFIKEAKRLGIRTVSMPKGWDNVAKLLYRVLPDTLIVHNNIMKEASIKEQRMPEHQIIVTGFPQFDMYLKKSIFLLREEYCKRTNLDPSKRIIFFGSEGSWSPKDDTIVEMLIHLIQQDAFPYPASLIIRPHFSDIKAERFKRFKNIKDVWVDDSITISDFFWDNWDSTIQETELFINSLYHSDVIISIASTLALDACALDKPITAVGFGALYHLRSHKDITARLFESDHYQSVMETNAVDFVTSKRELFESISAYMKDQTRKSKERELLLDTLCYKVDGRSSERIVDTILNES